MPWEVTIVNYAGSPPASYHAPGRPDPQPLGARDDVIAAIREAVPEFQWGMVGGLPPEVLAKFSPEVAAILSNQKLKALYETDDLYVLLYGFEQEPIGYLHAEVRGTGNPVPLLARVCAGRSWSVASDADGSFLDLSAATAPQWDEFQTYRDRASTEVRYANG